MPKRRNWHHISPFQGNKIINWPCDKEKVLVYTYEKEMFIAKFDEPNFRFLVINLPFILQASDVWRWCRIPEGFE
jgi:hypothetical protein